MKIRNRTEYGVRALLLLAARDGELLSMAQIAELEAIPGAFLVQILAMLRKAGLVVAVRGASGGFRLARPAADITMAEVMQVLEGSLAPIDCAEEGQEVRCERMAGCQTRHVWVRMRESLNEALGNLTLEDVIKGA